MPASGVAWDKIITAAAASTLGVLSLGVLLVGVLAYLFFGRSDDRVKLWVFGAVLLSVIGLGVSVLRESQNTPADNRVRSAAPVAGLWRDNDGFSYYFDAAGSHVSFTELRAEDGAKVGSGDGTMSGYDMLFRYVDDVHATQGVCKARMAADGGSITGRCSTGLGPWPLAIERVRL